MDSEQPVSKLQKENHTKPEALGDSRPLADQSPFIFNADRSRWVSGGANWTAIPPLGGTSGKLAVVGWGSTFGPIHQAVRRARAKGRNVSHIHIRHINPMPNNMSVLLKGFRHILVPEMNSGQLKTILRDQFLVDARSLPKVSGHPFRIAEIEAAIDAALAR